MGRRSLLRRAAATATIVALAWTATTVVVGALPGPAPGTLRCTPTAVSEPPGADHGPPQATPADEPPNGSGPEAPTAEPGPAAGRAPAGGGGLQQQIGFTILGGELTVPEPVATVHLVAPAGRPGTLVGTLPPVRVVDARGTHAGWTLAWSVTDLTLAPSGDPPVATGPPPDTPASGTGDDRAASTVAVAPGPVDVVHGLPGGLEPGRACQGEAGTLARATPGTGGGTYQAGATVTVALPPGATATSGQVTLAVTAR